MDDKRKKVKLTKEQKLKNAKKKKILFIIGMVMTGIQFIVSLVFIVFMHFVDILPTDYKVLIDILIILFCLVTFITQRWKVLGIITKVLSLLLSIILVIGSVYINSTYNALSKISGTNTKTVKVGVYVLAENGAEELKDVKDATFGIIDTMDRDNTDKTIEAINDKLGAKITISEYDGMTSLVDALYKGEAEAIIMNESYADILSEIETYKNFSDDTKLIYEKTIEYVINSGNNDNYLSSDDAFTVYVSGIDVDGAPTENRNSDVNILLTVNKKTHQILMVNTPRDYYVPTSVSGGVPDKLTHAGCSGIDCSVETLEMLYGVNIDYYLKVNFTGFVKIIDSLGGVDVDSEFDFTTYHGGYHISKGVNHMDGQMALGFARERYAFGSGDNQRGKNQMQVIKAVIKKMESSDMLLNYTSVLSAISDSMVTNMSYDEIGDLVKMQLNDMPSWDVQTYAVTGTGANLPSYSLPSPNYVMLPNQETVEQAKIYLREIHNNETIKVQ